MKQTTGVNRYATKESRSRGGKNVVEKKGREWMRKIGKRGRKKQLSVKK